MIRVCLALVLLAGTARADLADATRERRVFRQVMVGALQWPGDRLTWVFFRGRTSAALTLFCQEAKKVSQLGLRLDGKENDESLWLPPTEVRYEGSRAGERYELSAAAGQASCPGVPARLVLGCAQAKLSVLEAGATLIPGKKLDNEVKLPFRWQPAVRKTIAALRCQVEGSETPLVFAPGTPGIEWADENSDMVVQTGAYREIPLAP